MIIYAFLLTRDGDAAEGDSGQDRAAACEGFLGNGNDILEKVCEITVDHGLAQGFCDLAVFHQEAILGNAREIALAVGAAARESADDDAALDILDDFVIGRIAVLDHKIPCVVGCAAITGFVGGVE